MPSISHARPGPNPLSSILGTLFGLILYPLKSILMNSILIVLLILPVVLVGSVTALVELVKLISRVVSNPLLKYSLYALSVLFAACIVLPLILSSFVLSMIVIVLVDIVSSVILGIKDGRNHGLFSVLNNFLREWKIFSTIFQICTKSENEVADLQVDYTHLEDVPKSPLDVPDLSMTYDSSVIEKLSDQEMADAKAMPELKVQVDQYERLLKKLTQLDQAIENRQEKHGDIPESELENAYENQEQTYVLPSEDDFTYLEMYKPVLLVKQMLVSDQWRIVPANTYVTDEYFLKKWVTENSYHPLNRDDLTNPTPTDDAVTRYRWHKYEGCSQELDQLAVDIRNALNINQEREDADAAVVAEPGLNSRDRLFAKRTAVEQVEKPLIEGEQDTQVRLKHG